MLASDSATFRLQSLFFFFHPRVCAHEQSLSWLDEVGGDARKCHDVMKSVCVKGLSVFYKWQITFFSYQYFVFYL